MVLTQNTLAFNQSSLETVNSSLNFDQIKHDQILLLANNHSEQSKSSSNYFSYSQNLKILKLCHCQKLQLTGYCLLAKNHFLLLMAKKIYSLSWSTKIYQLEKEYYNLYLVFVNDADQYLKYRIPQAIQLEFGIETTKLIITTTITTTTIIIMIVVVVIIKEITVTVIIIV